MDNPRIHLTFTPEKDLTGEVTFYTVVGVPVEGPTPNPFPERTFTTIDDLEHAMTPTISPDVLAKIRQALADKTRFIFEVDAEQAAALHLFSQMS